jgi:hypothetical protein
MLLLAAGGGAGGRLLHATSNTPAHMPVNKIFFRFMNRLLSPSMTKRVCQVHSSLCGLATRQMTKRLKAVTMPKARVAISGMV